jgi:carotenoid 1,2-hydratase
MRILFGQDNDTLHMNPHQSGAYEWWYFDALSDDGRWALVAIFFLGSPMSPYYKAVVAGKNPSPLDWCGVFVTLHESVSGQWVEREYAYNLYRHGDFTDAPNDLTIGNSHLQYNGNSYRLILREKHLWVGETRIEAEFTPKGAPLLHPPLGEASDPHTWVCVAPVCAMEARVTRAGQPIVFRGHGYHDHNFGQLPWHDVAIWYWGEAQYRNQRTVFYCTEYTNSQSESLFLRGEADSWEIATDFPWEVARPTANRFGLSHQKSLRLSPSHQSPYAVLYDEAQGSLSNGPFYRRLAVVIEGDTGIGEVFCPQRLVHPLWSWLMWTRIRRRG